MNENNLRRWVETQIENGIPSEQLPKISRGRRAEENVPKFKILNKFRPAARRPLTAEEREIISDSWRRSRGIFPGEYPGDYKFQIMHPTEQDIDDITDWQAKIENAVANAELHQSYWNEDEWTRLWNHSISQNGTSNIQW